MQQRRRFNYTTSPKDRLVALAKDLREKAEAMPEGSERDGLLTKAGRADTAAHLEDWANSPGLQPPK
jgi:hypothetical protein